MSPSLASAERQEKFPSKVANAGMDRQILAFIVFVILAVSVPVAILSGPDWWGKLAAAITGEESPSAGKGGGAVKETGTEGTKQVSGGTIAGRAEELVATSVNWEEIFRFDLTPEDLARRFPRISVGLGLLQWQGYRVPVVTGTRPDDLAGSLSYYFDSRGQLAMIEFVGSTGAVGRLVSFCHQRFGLAQRITNSPAVFYYERPHPKLRQTSYLVIRPAPVLEAGDPYQRFSVELRLYNDPPPPGTFSLGESTSPFAGFRGGS
jgi:hypothetical protein